MSRLRTYDFRCLYCTADGDDEADFDAIVRVSVEDGPDGGPVVLEMPACPWCGSAAEVIRIPSAPAVMRTAMPDGTSRGDAWDLAKEAAKLRRESFKLRREKRGELQREIKRLEQESSRRYRGPTDVMKGRHADGAIGTALTPRKKKKKASSTQGER